MIESPVRAHSAYCRPASLRRWCRPSGGHGDASSIRALRSRRSAIIKRRIGEGENYLVKKQTSSPRGDPEKTAVLRVFRGTVKTKTNQVPDIWIDLDLLHEWLSERMKACGFTNTSEFGRALGMKNRSQIHNLLLGKSPIGPSVLKRLNAIDPEYEIEQACVAYKKKPLQKSASSSSSQAKEQIPKKPAKRVRNATPHPSAAPTSKSES